MKKLLVLAIVFGLLLIGAATFVVGHTATPQPSKMSSEVPMVLFDDSGSGPTPAPCCGGGAGGA